MSGFLPPNRTGFCEPYGERRFAIAVAFSAAAGCISFLASCFAIFIIILFKKWRFFSQRLILYLAIAATLTSLSSIVRRVDYENQVGESYENYCIFSGFFNQSSFWTLFTSIISIVIFMVLRIFTSIKVERFEVIIIIFIFIFPLTFNWIPFINRTYGNAGPWCWIRSLDKNCERTDFGRALQLVLYYIPIYSFLFILIVIYIIIGVKLYRTKKKWTGNIDFQTERTKKQIKQEVIPLMSYPLLYFVFNLPALITRLHAIANRDKDPQLVLWILTTLSFPLQGGVMVIAFALDPETRKRLKIMHFRAAFSDFFRSKNIKEYPLQHMDSVDLKEELLDK